MGVVRLPPVRVTNAFGMPRPAESMTLPIILAGAAVVVVNDIWRSSIAIPLSVPELLASDHRRQKSAPGGTLSVIEEERFTRFAAALPLSGPLGVDEIGGVKSKAGTFVQGVFAVTELTPTWYSKTSLSSLAAVCRHCSPV